MSNNSNNSPYQIVDLFNIKDTKTRSNVITYNSVDTTDNIAEITSNDVKFARDNITSIIEVGQSALSELLNLATQGQQPKAFDSMSVMMKVLLDANKDLLNIHKQNQELTGQKEETPNKVTNNNLIVGSMDDVLKMLDNHKKKDESD